MLPKICRAKVATVRLVLMIVLCVFIYRNRNSFVTNVQTLSISFEDDEPPCFATHGLCITDDANHHRCAMSVNKRGRLGNNMAQYATLLAMARWNRRPAFLLPETAQILRDYFQVTMPALSEEARECIENNKNWTALKLAPNMRDNYRHLDLPPEQPLMIIGHPSSWTFYDHLRQELKKEFRLHEPLRVRAQGVLRSLLANRTSATFVGVHARRTDYVRHMNEDYDGVVADARFFEQAMDYFRSLYSDSLFIVVSDDMPWCLENMNNSVGDIVFAGSGVSEDPIYDLSLLMQCNHSIITIGTYGYWAAYLVGGETVYLTNYTLPDSSFLERLNYSTKYLPSWKPIAADLSELKTPEGKKRIQQQRKKRADKERAGKKRARGKHKNKIY